jgi:hypothetical protein
MPRKVFTAGEVLAAADVNEFLQDQVVMTFAGTAARGSAIGTATEGMVTYLEDSNLIEAYNSSAWTTVANAGTASYNLVQTLYFTSSGTFTKATYPWLRAIKVKVQGAGGGGGGCTSTIAGQVALSSAGGGGVYSESFITDITGLDASITVTRGAAGSGGAAGSNAGANGGTSSFGSIVSANGGNGGAGNAAFGPYVLGPANSATTGTGDLVIAGGSGSPTLGFVVSLVGGGMPGGSFMGNPGFVRADSGNGINADTKQYGAGGSGGINSQSQATARSGGNGAPGIVIVELYA